MRKTLVSLLVCLILIPAASSVRADSNPTELVEKARLTTQKLLNHPKYPTLQKWMKRAKGVLIVPQLLKAGFIIGGEGGAGVLLGRDKNGNWSAPAFYTIGSGSIGLQIGVQDAEVMFVIMTDAALTAMINRQVKLGADASIAVGPTGQGVEGATGIDLDADIYSFAMTRGAFAGVSFEGSVAVEKEDYNKTYYGKAVNAESIVLKRTVSNPHAGGLIEALSSGK